MKKLDLAEALNYLSDKTVAEADIARNTNAAEKRFVWVKYAALAACAALAVFAGIYRGAGERLPVVTESNFTEPIVTEPSVTEPSVTEPSITEPSVIVTPDSTTAEDPRTGGYTTISSQESDPIDPTGDGSGKLVIALENNGMGFEGYSVNSADEITDGNPWQELNITEETALPVFARRMQRVIEDNGMIRDYDVDYMTEQLLYYAERLGFDMDNLVIEDDAMSAESIEKTRETMEKYGHILPDDYGKAEEVRCEQNGIEISVDVFGLRYRTVIRFKNGYGMPEGANIGYYYDGTYEEAVSAAEWLLPRYEWLMGNNDAATAEVVAADNYYVLFYHSLINGDFVPYENEDGTLTEHIVPEEDIITTILNYNFNRVEFRDSQIWIYDLNESYRYIGDYAIITPEQALERIDSGKFLTTAPDVSKKSQDVEKLDLVYRSDGIPYYRCFVEMGDYFESRDEKIYTVYYVPAVADEYIDGATQWNGSFN